MHRLSLYSMICLILLIPGGNILAQQKLVKYRVSTDKSEIAVKVFKVGLISMFGHDHVIKADKIKGFVYFNNKLLYKSSVNISVAANSFDPDLPVLRKKYGLTDTLSGSDRTGIRQDMIAANQLNIDKYPDISFVSDIITKDKNDNYIVSGKLHIHGIERRIILPVKIEIRGDILNASGSFYIKQSDYGIEPFSTALGTIKNKDKVEIIFNIWASSENII